MTRILAITNQKGGVGKTTTCINLCAALALARRRVLLVDLDPQGNATMGCGIDKHGLERSVCDLLLGEAPPQACIQPAPVAGIDVLPANADLTAAEVALMHQPGRERRLQQALQTVAPDYDYVLVDCPPSLNMLTINALVAAAGVLIPVQCEYYALEGLTALLETVRQIRETINPGLEIDGLVRTMFDARNRLAGQVSEQLLAHFGDRVYRTIVPRNVRLAEAPSHGMPILAYDKGSRGAIAYLALAGELLRRDEARRQAAGTAVVAEDEVAG